MSETLTPKTNPLPKQEGINPEQLTAENKETLTESVKRQVAEALEKIRKRVKAKLERDKIKKNFETNNYNEIFVMIEDYPENIQKIILQKIKEEFETIFMKNIKEKNYNQIFELIDNFPPEIGLEIINKYFDRLIPIPSQVKKINEIKYDEETNQSYLNCINRIDENIAITSENKPYAKHQCEVKKLQREENKKVLLEEERKFILKIISIYNQLTPENKERLGNYQDVISDIYLANREIFNPIFKDKEGKEKLKKGVNEKLKKIIEKENIPLIIQNLDLIYNFEENSLLRSNIENILLKVDEAVIQEELKTCPDHIRKLYEERFEKRYIKREYLEKAITGARVKFESAQTEEERKKYEQVIEGLEYLRDWEKNVREHCRKMFEKEGIMPPKSVEYWIQEINEFKIANCEISNVLERNADKLGLTLIEYIAFLQIKLNETMKRMTMYSFKHPESILDALNPKIGRFIGARERSEYSKMHSPIPARSSQAGGSSHVTGYTRTIMEIGVMGPDYNLIPYHREKNLSYGYLNKRNYPNSTRDSTEFEWSPDNSGHYGILTAVFDEEIKNKATFSFGDSGVQLNNTKGSLLSLVSLPHISSVIHPLSKRLYDSTQGEYNPQVTDSDTLMLDEDFVINVIINNFRNKGMQGSYIEVQYHGITGSPNQIEYIVWYPRSRNIDTTYTEQVPEFIEMRKRIEEYNKEHPERPIKLILASDYHKLRRENNES